MKKDGEPTPKALDSTKAVPSTSTPMKPKAKRMNWSLPENKKKLDKAIEEWKDQSGRMLDGNGEALTLPAFANTVGVPYHTLRKYVCEDESKRRETGKSVGVKPLIAPADQKFLRDTIIRHDRANDGKNPAETINLIQEMNPNLSRKQASQVWNRTIHPKIVSNGGIKPKPVKAQGTTTK